MGELYQITTGPHTAVFGYVWNNPPIDKLGNEQRQFFMYAGFALQKSIETRYHGGFDIAFRKRLPGSGGMAADDVVLSLREGFIFNTILGHGAKAGIDAIDDFVVRECFQEIETLFQFLHTWVGECQWLFFKQNLI